MSTASPGSNIPKPTDNEQDLTDFQINALISSTQNSPSVSHHNSISGASTEKPNPDWSGDGTRNNSTTDGTDMDMALLNILGDETTIVDQSERNKARQSIPEVKKEEAISVASAAPKLKNEEDAKIFKQEFSRKSLNDNEDDEDDSSRISAYARLDFPNFTFYVQTLQVLLGRKIDNDEDNSVDVHLGATKAISRRHGKIFYNFGTQRFELSILGRNGAFVDETFVETGVTLPLKNNTKIQIGEIPFQFVLPTPGSNIRKNSTRKQLNPADAINLKTSLYNNSSPSRAVRQSPETDIDQSKDKKSKEKPIKKVKQPKKVYTLEEIPEKYRTKPSCSYSHLIAVCLKERSTERGMSLSEIYKGIQDLYPYYHYCPDGWQSSVRHNLSLNKSFKKVSKEGKGWLWGLDEEFCAEKEKQNNVIKKSVIPTQQLPHGQASAAHQQYLKQPSITGTSHTTPSAQASPQALNQSLSQQSSPALSTLKNNGTPPSSTGATLPGRLTPGSTVKPSTSSQPPQGNKSIAQLASEIQRPASSATSLNSTTAALSNKGQSYNARGPAATTPNNIQAQLAANRATPKQIPSGAAKSPNVPGTNVIVPNSSSTPSSQATQIASAAKPPANASTAASGTNTSKSTSPAAEDSTTANSKLSGDTMKALNYLQQELIRLTKDRKGLDKKTTTQILTQALAMTISQVNQAAKNSGMTGNPLVLLIDKNPQHLTKILTAALNAATYQVTKGKVKPGMVNNNVSSSSNSSASSTPARAAPQKPTNTPARATPKSSYSSNEIPSVTPSSAAYPTIPRQGSTKPPINDKFKPPHVTNPMPQQISRPTSRPPATLPRPQTNAPVPSSAKSIVGSAQQSNVAAAAQQQQQQQQQQKTPKPPAFSKPPAYNSRPPLPTATKASTIMDSGTDSSASGTAKPKLSKPSSYSTPVQRVATTPAKTVVQEETTETKGKDLLDTDPLNDPEFDKVLESLSRQGTPGLSEHDESEPVDLDKLLAEDEFLNEALLNEERGVKRRVEDSISNDSQQNKVMKID